MDQSAPAPLLSATQENWQEKCARRTLQFVDSRSTLGMEHPVEFESRKRRGVAPIKWIKRGVQCPIPINGRFESIHPQASFVLFLSVLSCLGLSCRGARVLDFPLHSIPASTRLEFPRIHRRRRPRDTGENPCRTCPDFVLDPAAFIQTTGAAVALAQSAWARGDRAAASNRITIGVIGWGMMGPANTKAFLAEGDCRLLPPAICMRNICRPRSTPSTPAMETKIAKPITTIANCWRATMSTQS